MLGQPSDPIVSLEQNWQQFFGDLLAQSACYGARPVFAN